jgi:hypothetical protein
MRVRRDTVHNVDSKIITVFLVFIFTPENLLTVSGSFNPFLLSRFCLFSTGRSVPDYRVGVVVVTATVSTAAHGHHPPRLRHLQQITETTHRSGVSYT